MTAVMFHLIEPILNLQDMTRHAPIRYNAAGSSRPYPLPDPGHLRSRSPARDRAPLRHGQAPPTRTRLLRLLPYYCRHFVKLAADPACTVLVSATALALPLRASIVSKRLVAAGDPAEAVWPTLPIGALMLALGAV